MNSSKRHCFSALFWLPIVLAGTSVLGAADGSNADDIAALKAQIAAQQKQLEELRSAIANQQRLLERVEVNQGAASRSMHPTRLGDITSATPMIPPAPVHPTLPVMAAQASKAASGNPCEQGAEGNSVPPYLRMGNVCIQPVGFMDFTSVWRDRDAGSSIGSNFGSVPYNNVAASKLSEFRLSPQNSRVGFRVDGNWKDVHFIGYNEFDFL